MILKQLIFLISTFFTFLFLVPVPTYAHAFGTNYTLPLPLWLYLYGGGAVVAFSFLLVAFFTRTGNSSYPKLELGSASLLNILKTFLGYVLGTFLVLSVVAGFIGSPSPIQNLAPNFFWIILLLGGTYLSSIIGSFWITNLFNFKPVLKYPKKLGYIPALLFYFFLIWIELLSNGLAVRLPILSIIIAIYLLITFIGGFIFGKDWFRYGDFFSIFFNLIGRISIFEVENNKLYLRPPFVGLLEESSDKFSLLLFIIFMLSSTSFDGFRGTKFSNNLNIDPLLEMFLVYIVFLGAYLKSIWLMKLIVARPFKELALKFSFSLVPIALAYNIAHYYTLLLTQGQQMIVLISDPFNKSWNLFGTSGYKINLSVINANSVWHTEVAVILIGHIAAVYIAHIYAVRAFGTKKALASQIPMLILMVIYTITGLWLLSQPITGG
jgi:hypothetical protein